MTAPHIVDPAGLLGEALAEASPDLMRQLLQTMINALLSADADAVCGAEWGKPSPDRVTQRNGYRHRELDTRVGTIDVAVPKLRKGTYFPEWLLERRKRAEAALITVVADCYLAGVSTRRMDKLVKALGITGMSKSQVSVMAGELDQRANIEAVVGRAAQILREGAVDLEDVDREGTQVPQRGMAGAEIVIVAFGPPGETGKPAFLAQRANALAPAGQDLVGIALVAHVEHQTVLRRVEHPVDGHRQLHHAQIGCQMPACP